MAEKKRPIGKRNEKAERSPKKTAPASRSAKMNEKLQKTNQTLNALIRYSPLAIICVDLDTNVLIWNPMAEHVFGWSEAEVLGRKNPIVPEEKQEEYDRLRRKVQEGAPYSSKELIRQRKDGSLIHLNASSATLHNDDGDVIALLGIFEDITERKKTEETLRENERRFRGAFENAAVGASMVDLTGRFTKVNRFLCEMLGYSKEELLSKTFSDITHPDDVKIGLDYMKRQIAGEMEFASFEKRYFRKDGSIVHLIISPALISDDRGAPQYFVGLFQDITERKQAEDALRESEEKFSKSFQKAPLLITLSDVETGRLLEVNEKFLEVSGFTRDEVIGRTVVELGWNSEEQRSRMRQSFLERGRVEGMELTLRRKDGRAINCLYNGEAITVSGKPRLLSIAQDITERKLAEEKVRQSEAKYRNLFELSTDGIFILDLDGNFIDVNTTAYTRLGYTKEELLALHIGRLDHPEFAGQAAERMTQIREHGFAVFESAHLRKDGTAMPVEVNSRLIEYDGRTVFFSVIRDITERKKAEELILRSLKEKEVLLKEIHHRVKNNMQVIYSLLNLQAKGITDTTVRAMFEESRDRVLSMALIHEKLYRSKDLAHIDFKEYLQSLVYRHRRTPTNGMTSSLLWTWNRLPLT